MKVKVRRKEQAPELPAVAAYVEYALGRIDRQEYARRLEAVGTGTAENRPSGDDSREADRGDPVRFFSIGCIMQQWAYFCPFTPYMSGAAGKVTKIFRQFSTSGFLYFLG